MPPPRRQIFSVGHSNHPIAKFCDLLRPHGVTAIADVRSTPYSRFAPQYNQEPLRRILEEECIKYVYLGRELGGRSSDHSCYENGRVSYERLAQSSLFQTGLERLVQGISRERVALMCTEKDPLDCHRSLLVAGALVQRGIAVDHILVDGTAERHGDSMLRLLDRTGQLGLDLFSTIEDRIDEALRQQEARIAYVDKELENTSDVSTP